MKLTTIEDIVKAFGSMDGQQQKNALALLMHWLTVYARGFSADPPCELALRRLQGINELEHHLSSQLSALVTGRSRYADDVFWKGLLNDSARFGLSEPFLECVNSAFSRCVDQTQRHGNAGSDNGR
jgi:hypothetical protein